MGDILKLIILITLLAAAIGGIHYLGTLEDSQAKYKHPIIQQGSRW